MTSNHRECAVQLQSDSKYICILPDSKAIRCFKKKHLLHAMFLTMNFPALNEKFFYYSDINYTNIFLTTPYNHLYEVSPYYSTISTQHSFCHFLLDKPEGLAWLAWGTARWEDMVTHWRGLLSVILPDEKITHFRHYSSTVMADFLPACTTQELLDLLGPITGMAVPLPDGTWLFAERPAPEPVSGMHAQSWHPRQSPWWLVSDKQLAALSHRLRATLVYNIRWDVWQNEPSLIEPFESFEALDHFIQASIEQAERWGFTLPKQQEAFARLCLAAGTENMESKPACAAILYNPQLSPNEKIAELTLLSGEA